MKSSEKSFQTILYIGMTQGVLAALSITTKTATHSKKPLLDLTNMA